MTEDITFHFPPQLGEKAHQFFEYYDLISVSSCPSTKMKLDKQAADKVCRFCGKGYPKVTFRNEAHVIPFLLGNEYWITDDECDSCNSLFNKRENHLVNFIGISRTLNGTVGRNGIPQFDTSTGIGAKEEMLFKQEKAIAISNFDGQSGSFEKTHNEIRFTAEKKPYAPINVYKALLKIGLAIIPKGEIPRFKVAFKFLLNKKPDQGTLTKCIFSYYQMQLGYGPSEAPAVFLYKKKENGLPVATYYFSLYYKNYFFNLPLPLYDLDYWLYDGNQKIPLLDSPPVFTSQKAAEEVSFSHFTKDFASYENVRGEKETFVMYSDIPFNEQTAINPETLEEIINPEVAPIKTLYLLTNNDFSIKLNKKAD